MADAWVQLEATLLAGQVGLLRQKAALAPPDQMWWQGSHLECRNWGQPAHTHGQSAYTPILLRTTSTMPASPVCMKGFQNQPTTHVVTTAGMLLDASAPQPLHEKPTLGSYDTFESATAVHGCSKRSTGPQSCRLCRTTYQGHRCRAFAPC